MKKISIIVICCLVALLCMTETKAEATKTDRFTNASEFFDFKRCKTNERYGCYSLVSDSDKNIVKLCFWDKTQVNTTISDDYLPTSVNIMHDPSIVSTTTFLLSSYTGLSESSSHGLGVSTDLELGEVVRFAMSVEFTGGYKYEMNKMSGYDKELSLNRNNKKGLYTIKEELQWSALYYVVFYLDSGVIESQEVEGRVVIARDPFFKYKSSSY